MDKAPIKQVLVVRRDLKVRRGKEISQGGHAALAWLATLVTKAIQPDGTATIQLDPVAIEWLTSSYRKATVHVPDLAALLALHEAALARGLRSFVIRDAGLTEFHDVETVTMIAIGPARDEDVDALTGNLPLY